jgi:hypothetical protein
MHGRSAKGCTYQESNKSSEKPDRQELNSYGDQLIRQLERLGDKVPAEGTKVIKGG